MGVEWNQERGWRPMRDDIMWTIVGDAMQSPTVPHPFAFTFAATTLFPRGKLRMSAFICVPGRLKHGRELLGVHERRSSALPLLLARFLCVCHIDGRFVDILLLLLLALLAPLVLLVLLAIIFLAILFLVVEIVVKQALG